MAIVKCCNCGEGIYRKPNQIKRANEHYCSIECQASYKHKKIISPIETRYNKPIRDILENLYLDKKYSIRRLAKEIDVEYRTVMKWMKKYNIKARHGSEAVKTQWMHEDAVSRRELSRKLASTVLNTEENRNKLRKIMQTSEYREKQRITKLGSKNGMYGVSREKHPNWNPNLTDEERERSRKNIENYEWRKAVFEKDSYTCIKCGYDKGGKIVAHHMNSHDTYIGQRYDVGNGVTLCEDCHKEFHGKYGYGKNTREQFEEYLMAK